MPEPDDRRGIMRPYVHLCWVLPFLGVAALAQEDLPQPRKDASAPARMPDLNGQRPDGSRADRDAAELQRRLGQLRAQRDALRAERTEASRQVESGGGSHEEEMARLRRRL